MNKTVLAMLVVVVCIGLSATAYAGQVGTSFVVNATVIEACTVSALGVDFPAFDGITDVRAAGGVTVNCPTGVDYTIALDGGLNYSGIRAMSNGVDTLNYGLLQPSPPGGPWGDAGTAAATNGWLPVSDTGNGLDQPHVVSGIVYGSQSVSTGDYSDTINVTVYY